MQRRDKPLCTSAGQLCISVQRGVRVLHSPYSVSNAHFKGKLHLVLAIPFPLNSLLCVIPETVLFIRRHSGLRMSICEWESSVHFVVTAEHTEEMLLLLLFGVFFLIPLRSWWFPLCFLDYQSVQILYTWEWLFWIFISSLLLIFAI